MKNHKIMVQLMLTPDEVEYVLMILAGIENLHHGKRSREIREVLGLALRESVKQKVMAAEEKP